MKKLAEIKIKDAFIDVWEDETGQIILGGWGWFEFFDYEKMKEVSGGSVNYRGSKANLVEEPRPSYDGGKSGEKKVSRESTQKPILRKEIKELLDEGLTVCLNCGYHGEDIQKEDANLYDGYGCPKCHAPLAVASAVVMKKEC